MLGRPVTNLEAARAAAQSLGVPNLIITLGAAGAIVVVDATAEHVPAPSVAAVDSTGAGDAFIGSLAVFWGQGLGLIESVRRANSVAALSVTRHGAQESFPKREDIQFV
jgi:ribokinase